MLIHKLTKIIKQDVDDNISFVERDHPFSGRLRSQVILTFKEQKTKVSIVQTSDISKLYVCIINRKVKGKTSDKDGGGSCWGIQLEKDVEIPIKLICDALADGARGDYSIKSCYGCNSSCWKDAVKEYKF